MKVLGPVQFGGAGGTRLPKGIWSHGLNRCPLNRLSRSGKPILPQPACLDNYRPSIFQELHRSFMTILARPPVAS